MFPNRQHDRQRSDATSDRRAIAAAKRRLIAAIERQIRPHLRLCNMMDDDENLVQIAPLCKPRHLRGAVTHGLVDNDVEGFVDYGVINAAYDGGVGVLPYTKIAVEDLMRLERLVDRLKRNDFI